MNDQLPTVMTTMKGMTHTRHRRLHHSRCRSRVGARTIGLRPLGTIRALGDGISRDPLGERGGKGIYGFVANDPVAKGDGNGLTIVNWNNPPGPWPHPNEPPGYPLEYHGGFWARLEPSSSAGMDYWEADLGEEKDGMLRLGTTVPLIALETGCGISCEQSCWVPRAYLQILYFIKLSTHAPDWHAKRESYGHEQRHVDRYIQQHTELIAREMRIWEKMGRFKDRSACVKAAEERGKLIISELEQINENGFLHKDGHPIAETPYDPIGEMPLKARTDPIPTSVNFHYD